MLLAIIFILYAGLILGVSFISAPVKFMVPNLPVSLALEIGKATFHLFNKIEWVICIIAIIVASLTESNLNRWWFIGGLFVLLLIETFYLLPTLDIRIDSFIKNGSINPSIFHWLYISADVLKVFIALTGGFWLMIGDIDEGK